MSTSQRIKDYALDIGFCRVGIAPADDFDEFIELLEQRGSSYDWWVHGRREPLEWARPAHKVPGTQSLLVLVYDYAQREFPPQLCKLMGRIYQSRSYLAPETNINGARLQLMRRFLADEGISSEDAPWLPQRWAANRAGLTHFGKNTFAYANGIGSFIVINTLLLNVQLEYDQPGPRSKCPADCTLCLEACPTAAMTEPYVLNPRRCLAFNAWMIDSYRDDADFIPKEIRPLMGQRIHGCDACQEACPQNHRKIKASYASDPFLQLLADKLTLEQILHMPPGYYETYIQPVMYNYIRDLRLFQRNAAVALGNTHDARYLPDLEQELSNPDAMIRTHVAWAISQIGGESALALLKQHLPKENDERVREEITTALQE